MYTDVKKTIQIRLDEDLSKAVKELRNNGINVNFRIRAYVLRMYEQLIENNQLI